MAIPLIEWSITVNGDPYKYDLTLLKEWENAVANKIIRGEIVTRRAGVLILGRIRSSRGDVEIFPRYKDGLNAEATWKLKTNNSGKVVGYDNSKIVIWYKPQQWQISNPPSRQIIPNDLRAFEPAHLRDEVLFHELVHAGRLLDGFSQKAHKLKPNPDDVAMYADQDTAAYNDIEEFVTILVTNIYLSEKGQKVFRASHGGGGYPFILDQTQSSSDGFLTKPGNAALVKMFCQTDPIAPKLAEIDTLFNPVRASFRKRPQDLTTNKSLQPK